MSIYLASWSTHQQVFGTPRGLFYACEAMRRVGGTVVALDDGRALVDHARPEPLDVGPRCPRDKCRQRCQDPSQHADDATRGGDWS